MHLRCPHCQNPIEIADLPSAGEITCAGCGSSFQLANFSTGTWAGPTNKRMGKFEVLGTLGQGAFGTVLKAHDTELDRIVAIKVPRASNVGPDPQDVDRFLREARSVAQLRFPSIITIHEVGADKGTPYLVCDFVEGVTLADLLTGRRPAFRESAKLIAEVADALHYAHALGVVHRDVKPSNIMVRPDGSPCVMDFGLAKREAGEITMTIDGQILGTPAYMSPEQARGEGHCVDGRSDVYSLGAILYQLLTGELPFRGNKAMLLHQVLHDEPRSPRTLNDKVPRDLETIALKAMAKDPRRRYASAKEMADDLRRWLMGEPIQARPVGALERVWRWCKRQPALAAASAAALLGVLLALVTFAIAFFAVSESLDAEREQRVKAESLAEANQLLAEKESRAAENVRIALSKNEEITNGLRYEQRQSKTTLAGLALEKGRSLGEQGEAGRGMLWLARGLTYAREAEDPDLERVLRLNLGALYGRVHPWRTAFRHSGWVLSAVFSPDGKTVLTGCRDKSARLWDVATGRQIGPPLLHESDVRAVAFSPDGKTMLTGSHDHTAQLWDVASGKAVGFPLRHGDKIGTLAFSADGKTVRTAGADMMLREWQVATGERVGMPFRFSVSVPYPNTCVVAFSPDGKTILNGRWPQQSGQLWDVTERKVIGDRGQHRVIAAAYSPDGKMLLTGGDDSTARLCETATGKAIGAVLQHQDRVQSVAFSPDGKTVVTGSHDRTARLWDAQTGTPLGSPLQHPSDVFSVAFSPDSKTVLTGCGDGTARLWDVSNPFPDTPLPPGGAVAMAFSADRKAVVMARGGAQVATLRLWDTVTGKPLCAPVECRPPHIVSSVALSPDSNRILTARSSAFAAQLWDVKTGSPFAPPLQHRAHASSVAFSPDGKMVLSGSSDKTARLWDAATGEPLGPPIQHQGEVLVVAFGPDGKSVLTADGQSEARLWDVASRKLLCQTLRQSTTAITAVAISPDGKALLIGCADGTARSWNAATGKPMGPPLQHQGPVRSVAFSPDGSMVLTGSTDKSAQVWDFATGRPIGLPMRHSAIVQAVAFSTDGKIALSASQNRIVRSDVLAVKGGVEQIADWVEAITGMELSDDGSVRRFSWGARQNRSQQLAKFGGPPHLPETALRDKTDPAEAVAASTEAIRLDPKRASDHASRGQALYEKKDFDGAITAFKEAIRLNPKLGTAHASLGHALYEKRDFDGAIAAYREAIRLNPNPAHRHFKLGLALNDKGDLDGAIAALKEAIRLNPMAKYIHASLAPILKGKGDLVGAITEYKEIIRLDPKDGASNDILARLLAAGPDGVRDGRRAVELATRACELCEWKLPGRIDTLAAAYAEIGDFDKAVDYQKKTLALSHPAWEKAEGKEARARLDFYERKMPYRDPALAAEKLRQP